MDPRIARLKPKKRSSSAPNPEQLAAFEQDRAPLAVGLGLDAADVQSLRDQGFALLEGGKPDRARAVLSMSFTLGDRDPGLLLLLATACDLCGDRSAASRYFELGLEASAADPELREAALRWRTRLFETQVELAT